MKKQKTIKINYKELIIVFLTACLSVLFANVIKSSFITQTIFGTIDQDNNIFLDQYKKAGYRAKGYKDHMSPILFAPLDSCAGREDVVKILAGLENKGVKVIGLDVFFQNIQPGDSSLISVIRNYDNIVLPATAENPQGNQYSELGQYTYFIDDTELYRTGIVTQFINSSSNPVRAYLPLFPVADTCIPSFAFRIVEKYSPTAADRQKQRFLRRENADEVIYQESICYGRPLIDTLDVPSFLRGNENCFSQVSNNSIVLVGKLSDQHDMFETPISSGVPGLKIHAHIIDTMLNEYYLRQIPKSLNHSINLIILLLFASLFYASRIVKLKYWNLVLRISQITIIFLIFVCGSMLYINMWTAEIVQPVVTIGLFGISYDLVLGFYSLISDVFHYIKEK